MSVKVGDKVRFINANSFTHINTVKVGGVYDVLSVMSEGVAVSIRNGRDAYWLNNGEYEIITNEEDDSMTKEKAQVGDLIRIVKPIEGAGDPYTTGDILEVTRRRNGSDVFALFNGVEEIVADHEYVIHRKAGEEDSDVDLTQEPEGKYRIVNGVIVTDETEQAVRIRQAGAELTDLLVRKNHDYGDSFAQQYAKYGLMSALIRMDDKMRRLETLLDSEEQAQVSESLSDTLLDLAGYALLAYSECTKGGGV